jgi:hypothetical protein
MSREMDKSQIGRAGELAVELYALVTSGGDIDIYSPIVDDDHIDLVAGARGGEPILGIQVKTTPGLDRDGLVEARASYEAGKVREDANFLYAIVLLDGVRIQALWIIPSPELNHLAYRIAEHGREVLELRASPSGDDSFSAFRIDPMQLGNSLLTFIGKSGPPPQWLRALAEPR